MSTPFIGEIRLAGFNFPPQNWASCDGSLLSIAQNEALFNLIGTTYGGDGQQTFGLPNLLGRVPIHMGTDLHGSTYIQGQMAGSETVSLTGAHVPPHSHTFSGTTAAGTSAAPAANSVPAAATTATEPIYSTNTSLVTMTATGPAGSGSPHDNLMPYLCVNFIISLFGIFPSQN